MNFPEWITKKYVEWRGDAITGKSVSAFAKFIGVSQPVMSYWLQGEKIPNSKSISKLAQKYPEVYEVLGLETPDSVWLSKLPAELKEPFTSALKEMDAIFIERSIDPDSAEGKRIAAEVLSRHGFMVKEIS